MNRFEKSTAPSANPIGGIKMSVVNEVTIFPNAAPTTKPTARSITLPLIANALNSESIDMVGTPLAVSLAYKSIAAGNVKLRQPRFVRRWIDFAETVLVADVSEDCQPQAGFARFPRRLGCASPEATMGSVHIKDEAR